jgi:hypothetical protein
MERRQQQIASLPHLLETATRRARVTRRIPASTHPPRLWSSKKRIDGRSLLIGRLRADDV